MSREPRTRSNAPEPLPGSAEPDSAAAGTPSTLDITREVCPMTYVRVKLALERLQPGDVLEVLLKGDEPRKNVPESARHEGHEVLSLEPAAAPQVHRLRLKVRRDA